LRGARNVPHHVLVEHERLIAREEIVGALFTLGDINEHLERIRGLLEEELGGEEGLEEDDA
jgi:hypothetical protein